MFNIKIISCSIIVSLAGLYGSLAVAAAYPSPSEAASRSGRRLLDAAPSGDLLVYYAQSGDLHGVRAALAAGADINYQDRVHRTALFLAAYNGHKEIVEILLRAGANPNLQDLDGDTALRRAVFSQHKEIVEMLLRAGADINYQARSEDLGGTTALHWAAMNDSKEIVEMLLKYGADYTLQDREGRTPYMLAEINRHKDAARAIKTFVERPREAFLKVPQTPAPTPAPQPAVQSIECSICFEPLFSLPTVSTQCGHMFHDTCIREWLQKNTLCPRCRREAKEEPLIPLYP